MTLYQDKYRVESARLRHWDYRSRGWYFVTICAHHRRSIFGHIRGGEMRLSSIGTVADAELREIPGHYLNVSVDEHIVMPNHVHAVIMIEGTHYLSPGTETLLAPAIKRSSISPESGSLSAVVRSYKAGVTLKCRDLGFQQEIWQARFHDHLLRGERVISAVREYIRNNPANWLTDREYRP